MHLAIDFDPDSGTYYLTSTEGKNVYVCHLNASGNFVSAMQIGGAPWWGNDIGMSIASDGNGSVYTTGYFTDTADFDPGVGTYNLISNGGENIYVAKFSDYPLGISPPTTDESNSTILISPNPASGSFFILSANQIFHGTVQLFNLLGEKRLEQTIFNQSKKEITLQNISPGIYFVKANDGEKEYTRKLIVQ